MAHLIKIFSLYKLTLSDRNDEYVLLRTEQPSYSNASQGQENFALAIEAQKRKLLLSLYINQNAKGSQIEFIGVMHGSPFGDKLYSDKGQFKLPIFYQHTDYGKPWIILSNSNTISDFETELAEDVTDLESLKPSGPVKEVNATFITENDFDLSEIKNYDTKDIRDL
jgi:hypothetical protein